LQIKIDDGVKIRLIKSNEWVLIDDKGVKNVHFSDCLYVVELYDSPRYTTSIKRLVQGASTNLEMYTTLWFQTGLNFSKNNTNRLSSFYYEHSYVFGFIVYSQILVICIFIAIRLVVFALHRYNTRFFRKYLGKALMHTSNEHLNKHVSEHDSFMEGMRPFVMDPFNDTGCLALWYLYTSVKHSKNKNEALDKFNLIHAFFGVLMSGGHIVISERVDFVKLHDEIKTNYDDINACFAGKVLNCDFSRLSRILKEKITTGVFLCNPKVNESTLDGIINYINSTGYEETEDDCKLITHLAMCLLVYMAEGTPQGFYFSDRSIKRNKKNFREEAIWNKQAWKAARNKTWDDYLDEQMRCKHIDYHAYEELAWKWDVQPDVYEYETKLNDIYEDYEDHHVFGGNHWSERDVDHYGFGDRLYDRWGRSQKQFKRHRERGVEGEWDDDDVSEEGVKVKHNSNKVVDVIKQTVTFNPNFEIPNTTTTESENMFKAICNEWAKINGLTIDELKSNKSEKVKSVPEKADDLPPPLEPCDKLKSVPVKAKTSKLFDEAFAPGKCECGNLLSKKSKINKKRGNKCGNCYTPQNGKETKQANPVKSKQTTSEITKTTDTTSTTKTEICEKPKLRNKIEQYLSGVSSDLLKDLHVTPESTVIGGQLHRVHPDDKVSGVVIYDLNMSKIGCGEFCQLDGVTFLLFNKHFLPHKPRFIRGAMRLQDSHATELPFAQLSIRAEAHIDIAVIKVDTNLPSKVGSKVWDLSVSFKNGQDYTGAYLDVLRNGEWFRSTTQQIEEPNPISGNTNYAANSTNGDCGKAVIYNGVILGIHRGTHSDGVYNQFVAFGPAIRSFIETL